MTRPALALRDHGQPVVSRAVVWNTVMPALGVVLILGVPILPAIAAAAVTALAMRAVLAHLSPSGRPRRGPSARRGVAAGRRWADPS